MMGVCYRHRGGPALAVLVVAATLAGCSHGRDTRALAHQRPTLLPSASPAKEFTVTPPDGHRRTCPTGSEPVVNLTGAQFQPRLVGGVTFARGSYRIRLRGVVANETTAPVTVLWLKPHVGFSIWNATVTVPRSIPAESSVPLVIDGTYVSTGTQHVSVRAQLGWEWQSPALRRCADEGLVHDD